MIKYIFTLYIRPRLNSVLHSMGRVLCQPFLRLGKEMGTKREICAHVFLFSIRIPYYGINIIAKVILFFPPSCDHFKVQLRLMILTCMINTMYEILYYMNI